MIYIYIYIWNFFESAINYVITKELNMYMYVY